jgi:hypothetical protein
MDRSRSHGPDPPAEPFELLLDRQARVLLVRFGRALSDQAVMQMQDAVQRLVDAEGRYPLIIDFSAVEEIRLTTQFIAALGRRKAVMFGERRILVAPTAELFGLARMFEMNQATATGDHPLVLRSLEAALDALGVVQPRFEPLAARRPLGNEG